MGRISNPVGPPASKTSSSIAFANTGFIEWPNTPTRRADGSMSRNSSTLFPPDAEAITVNTLLRVLGRSDERSELLRRGQGKHMKVVARPADHAVATDEK